MPRIGQGYYLNSLNIRGKDNDFFIGEEKVPEENLNIYQDMDYYFLYLHDMTFILNLVKTR